MSVKTSRFTPVEASKGDNEGINRAAKVVTRGVNGAERGAKGGVSECQGGANATLRVVTAMVKNLY
jgi:hypothetical protein